MSEARTSKTLAETPFHSRGHALDSAKGAENLVVKSIKSRKLVRREIRGTGTRQLFGCRILTAASRTRILVEFTGGSAAHRNENMGRNHLVPPIKTQILISLKREDRRQGIGSRTERENLY